VQDAPGPFPQMRRKDRESLQRDAGNRLERMLKLMAKFAEGGPAVPWLPRDANLAAVRRMAARLRSGAWRPAHPSIDADAAAWELDRAVEQQRIVQEVAAGMNSHAALAGDVRARAARERLMHRRAAFHRLKLSPEAQDPESGAAREARELHRRRRKELGRPGRRRGNESEPPLTFVVADAQQVFGDPYGTSVAETLEAWFPAQLRHTGEAPWCSAPVERRGWRELQRSALSLLGEDAIPHLLITDACKGVYVPAEVEACGLTNIAGDPSILYIGAVGNLIEELERFARRRLLPTDDSALLELPERVEDGDLALLTYAQLLRAAHHARRARLPLWVLR